MKVEKKELYHFHNYEWNKELWTPGSEIDNAENYYSKFYIDTLYFRPVKLTKQGYSFFPNIISSYLKEEQDKETYIKLLKDAETCIREYTYQKREMILELVRKEIDPELPSRKNSIYLTDKESLEFWREQLKNPNRPLMLFRVEVTGDIFKSSDILLPTPEMDIEETYEQSKKYWNPNFNEIDNDKYEYLFKGKIKVLEIM